MKPVFKTLALVGALILIASPAWADDLNPPPWRGQPGTTYQQWEFLNNSTTPAPDFVNNPYGTPTTLVEPGIGQAWFESWGGRPGVWPLSGQMTINIPNRPLALPYKEIWIQLTWAAQAPGNVPLVEELLYGASSSVINTIDLGPTGEPVPADGNWYHTTYLIHLEPNPNMERVYISGGIMVDQLVIDTICAPEPSSLALVGLAGLALLRRR